MKILRVVSTSLLGVWSFPSLVFVFFFYLRNSRLIEVSISPLTCSFTWVSTRVSSILQLLSLWMRDLLYWSRSCPFSSNVLYRRTLCEKEFRLVLTTCSGRTDIYNLSLCLINQTITHNSFSCFTVLYSKSKELHELWFFKEVPDVAAVASII